MVAVHDTQNTKSESFNFNGVRYFISCSKQEKTAFYIEDLYRCNTNKYKWKQKMIFIYSVL